MELIMYILLIIVDRKCFVYAIIIVLRNEVVWHIMGSVNRKATKHKIHEQHDELLVFGYIRRIKQLNFSKMINNP